MGEAQYFSGQKIITEGDPPDFIFIIKDGEVSITKKRFLFKTVELGKLHPGDIFGETAMLSYSPRTATCTATKDTVCFLMFKSTFHYMLKYHPKFKKHVEDLSAHRTLNRKNK
jgi:CRP-like cAMP-binding protein